MQMRDVARGVQYINREQSLSQYLAFPSAGLSISALTPLPTKPTTKMAFAGRWEIEAQEGYDQFCKLLGEQSNTPLSHDNTCILLICPL